MMNIEICVPSYKRPKVKTFDYLPFAKVFVAESEYEEYIKANTGYENNILTMPDDVQGNISRVRNWILKTRLDEGNVDAVLMVDDDLSMVGYWEGVKLGGKKIEHKITTDEFMFFLEKHTQMAKDVGAYLWGVNIAPDPQNYRIYTPISTTSFIGAPFHCFLKGNNCYYDESMPLKEDYDMTLQQLNKNRIVLRFNKFFYKAKQSEQTGGCAAYRSRSTEKEQLLLLQKKWGSKIVKLDFGDKSNKRVKKKTKVDYNPIIKPPIRGV